jgi:hypothetical protein
MKTQLSFVTILLFVVLTLGLKKEEKTNTTTMNPANLAYFSVVQLGDDFQLTWVTTSEEKDSHIELEKSYNEREFQVVEIFKGTERNTPKSYVHLDTTPFRRTAHEVKIIYYRLKQVDANQIYTYSKVITIVRDDIYDVPNPTL